MCLFQVGNFGAGQTPIVEVETDGETLKPTTLATDQAIYGNIGEETAGLTAMATVKTAG